jgi:hypothetical protein
MSMLSLLSTVTLVCAKYAIEHKYERIEYAGIEAELHAKIPSDIQLEFHNLLPCGSKPMLPIQ